METINQLKTPRDQATPDGPGIAKSAMKARLLANASIELAQIKAAKDEANANKSKDEANANKSTQVIDPPSKDPSGPALERGRGKNKRVFNLRERERTPDNEPRNRPPKFRGHLRSSRNNPPKPRGKAFDFKRMWAKAAETAAQHAKSKEASKKKRDAEQLRAREILLQKADEEETNLSPERKIRRRAGRERESSDEEASRGESDCERDPETPIIDDDKDREREANSVNDDEDAMSDDPSANAEGDQAAANAASKEKEENTDRERDGNIGRERGDNPFSARAPAKDKKTFGERYFDEKCEREKVWFERAQAIALKRFEMKFAKELAKRKSKVEVEENMGVRGPAGPALDARRDSYRSAQTRRGEEPTYFSDEDKGERDESNDSSYKGSTSTSTRSSRSESDDTSSNDGSEIMERDSGATDVASTLSSDLRPRGHASEGYQSKKKTVDQDWSMIRKFNIDKTTADTQTPWHKRIRGIATLLTTIGRIEHPVNVERLFGVLVPGDLRATQLALNGLKDELPDTILDLMDARCHHGDCGRALIDRVINAKKNSKTSSEIQVNEAVYFMYKKLQLFDPEYQSAMTQASILASCTQKFNTEPLKDTLRRERSTRATVVEKVVALFNDEKPIIETETKDKMVGNFARALMKKLPSALDDHEERDTREFWKEVEEYRQRPVQYLEDQLELLQKDANASLQRRELFFSQRATSDERKGEHEDSNSRRERDHARKEQHEQNRERDRRPKGGRGRGSGIRERVYNNDDKYRNNNPQGRNPKPQREREKEGEEKEKVGKPLIEKTFCNSCGNKHINGRGGADHKCSWENHNHPAINLDKKKRWSASSAGKKAKAAGHDFLPWAQNLDGTPFEMKSKSYNLPSSNPLKGNGDIQSLIAHMNDLTKSARNLKLSIPVTNRKGMIATTKVNGALIDTGAVDNTYMGKRLANRLASRYGAIIRSNSTIIYTPDKGAKPFFSQGEIDFDVIIFNELTNK